MTGILGGTGVLLGAAGAHGLAKSSESMKDIWRTGSQYHMIHTLALGMSAMCIQRPRKRNIVCGCFSAGIVLFSGSLYIIVLLDEKKPLNAVAPFGGILLAFGWFAFGLL